MAQTKIAPDLDRITARLEEALAEDERGNYLEEAEDWTALLGLVRKEQNRLQRKSKTSKNGQDG